MKKSLNLALIIFSAGQYDIKNWTTDGNTMSAPSSGHCSPRPLGSERGTGLDHPGLRYPRNPAEHSRLQELERIESSPLLGESGGASSIASGSTLAHLIRVRWRDNHDSELLPISPSFTWNISRI